MVFYGRMTRTFGWTENPSLSDRCRPLVLWKQPCILLGLVAVGMQALRLTIAALDKSRGSASLSRRASKLHREQGCSVKLESTKDA